MSLFHIESAQNINNELHKVRWMLQFFMALTMVLNKVIYWLIYHPSASSKVTQVSLCMHIQSAPHPRPTS